MESATDHHVGYRRDSRNGLHLLEGVEVTEPYYQRDGITIYCADCRDVLPSFAAGSFDLVLTDPPYGISHPCDFEKRGRSNLADCRNYANVAGDNKPFDPSLWLDYPCILWGANHYASRLPDSGGWIVWDKERPDDLDQSTCELAWSNVVRGIRRVRWLWNGMMRASREPLVHPTQKPVAVMAFCLQTRWTLDCESILDPFMGSGTTLVAAKRLGRKAIGIELSKDYCDEAIRRLEQSVLAFPKDDAPTETQAELFTE